MRKKMMIALTACVLAAASLHAINLYSTRMAVTYGDEVSSVRDIYSTIVLDTSRNFLSIRSPSVSGGYIEFTILEVSQQEGFLLIFAKGSNGVVYPFAYKAGERFVWMDESMDISKETWNYLLK